MLGWGWSRLSVKEEFSYGQVYVRKARSTEVKLSSPYPYPMHGRIVRKGTSVGPMGSIG